MKLDWFTVAAQIGNFLLLLWLLKRFLYRPILAAMAARQQRVTAALAEAQAQAEAAEALQRDYLVRQQELSASRESWLTQARHSLATLLELITSGPVAGESAAGLLRKGIVPHG